MSSTWPDTWWALSNWGRIGGIVNLEGAEAYFLCVHLCEVLDKMSLHKTVLLLKLEQIRNLASYIKYSK